jgi:hypothetical protein
MKIVNVCIEVISWYSKYEWSLQYGADAGVMMIINNNNNNNYYYYNFILRFLYDGLFKVVAPAPYGIDVKFVQV